MKSPPRQPDQKEERVRYDAVLKDLFQTDHPALLDRLAEGVPIVQSLNVELALVEERRADLVFLLASGKLLHLDFQSQNDPAMVYRTGIYGLMIAKKYRRQIRQIVLYTGEKPMRMQTAVNIGTVKVDYESIDIREFDSETLLRSNRPGDCALAMLAQGGERRLRQIIQAAQSFDAPARGRALAQIGLLSGLRRLTGEFTMEVRKMSATIFVKDHAFLQMLNKQARAEGLAEGKAEGMTTLLAEMLCVKFGPLPKWAETRIRSAKPLQVERWGRKLLTANSLEAVIGKRVR